MEGKRILVTGASGGIGQAICRRFARPGNHLILHGGRNSIALNQIKQEVESLGAKADVWLHDFAQTPLFATERVTDLLAKVDLFIHGSGHALYKMLIDTTVEEWDALFNVHIKSAYLISQYILPHMVRERWGRIIFLSSIWGEVGASCEVAYASVKGAMNAFTRSLAKELAPSGVTVNAIAPGAIETRMVLEHFSPEELASLKEEIPSGRLGTPEEVSALVEFLSRDESSYITGQILHINGGWR